MAKINPVDRARFRIPLLPIFIVIAGVAVWYFGFRDTPEEPKDPHADIQTTPITGPLDAFQLAWSSSDVGDVSKFEIVDEDTRDTQFDRKAGALGWLDAGLPTIVSRSIEQPQKVRYTITFVLKGYDEPMKTFWEWTDAGWRIATWKLPRK